MKVNTKLYSTSARPQAHSILLMDFIVETGDNFATTPFTFYLDKVPFGVNAVIRKFVYTFPIATTVETCQLQCDIVRSIEKSIFGTTPLFTVVALKDAVTDQTSFALTTDEAKKGALNRTPVSVYTDSENATVLKFTFTGALPTGLAIYTELEVVDFK